MRVVVFPPKPQMLEKGKRQHRHQHVMVQAQPAPPLEMVEAKLFLHLLMRLLANPACLDRCRQALQREVLGMVGQVVLALS